LLDFQLKLILRLTIFLSFALLTRSSIAQYSEDELQAIDSLQKIVQSNAHDTLKLDALITWDNIIYQFNPDLDFELNQQMLEIAERGMNVPNIGASERELYIRYKGLACNNIGLIYNEYGNYKEALTNFQIGLEIAEYFQDSIRLGNATNNIGMIYMHMKMPEKAMEYYNRSITFDEDDAYSLATYHNNMGLVYVEMKDTAKAIESYLVSPQIRNDFC
jgi:tetratricopeptide (TPR) repeat protein